MKRLLSVALMVLVTLVGMVGVSNVAAQPVSGPLHQLQQQLQSGEVLYDLTGEWNVIYKQYDENYGSLEWIGSYKEIVKVKQEGYKFVGIEVVRGELAGKGPETIRGELDKKGFIKGQIYRADTGWRDCQGKITNDRKRITLSEVNVVKATLERK